MLASNIPNVFKSPVAKRLVTVLAESEAEFTSRGAGPTLRAMLLSVAATFKEDSQAIGTMLQGTDRALAGMTSVSQPRARQRVVFRDPNPNPKDPECETCPKVTTKSVTATKMVAAAKTVVIPGVQPDTSTGGVVPAPEQETLIMSTAHPSAYLSAEDVWRQHSGDIALLKKTALEMGLTKAKYLADPMKVAKAIYEETLKKKD